jgi:hypothetical protein
LCSNRDNIGWPSPAGVVEPAKSKCNPPDGDLTRQALDGSHLENNASGAPAPVSVWPLPAEALRPAYR